MADTETPATPENGGTTSYAEQKEIIAPHLKPEETPAAIETSVAATPETPVTPETVAVPEAEKEKPAEPEKPAIDFSKYGAKDEAEFEAKITEYKALEAQKAELEQFNRIKSNLKSPFADERIAKINAFVQGSGVKDLGVAQAIVTASPEELAKNPIRAIAYNEVLKNPALLDYMGVSDIEAGIRQRYGIEEGAEEMPVLAKMEMATALKELQTKVAEINTQSTDPFAHLLQEDAQRRQVFSDRVKKAEDDVNKAVSQFNVLRVERGGEKFEVAVSAEDLSKIKADTIQFASHIPSDQNYDSNVKEYIRARLENIKAEDVFTKFKEVIEGKAKETALKETHNGQPVVRKDKPAEPGKEKSEYHQHVEQTLRARGAFPPLATT